jgi:transposase
MEKKDILCRMGALNKNPEKITNHLFLEFGFFDPLDKVQIKYEMLRANQVDREKVAHICKQFNYSREAFYVILKRFKQQGFTGLLESPRQKKSTIMINQDIIKMIIQTKFKEPNISSANLTNKINSKFNTEYKKRTIEKAVATLGLTKKNHT